MCTFLSSVVKSLQYNVSILCEYECRFDDVIAAVLVYKGWNSI